MVEAPCKYCEMRGCGAFHSQCEKYLAFVKENKRRKDELNAIKDYENNLYSPNKRKKRR